MADLHGSILKELKNSGLMPLMWARDLIDRTVTVAFCMVGVTGRVGKVLGINEHGLMFRGKQEFEQNAKEQTMFIPWSSILWLEVEE